jgi:hypothetical protein
MLSQSVESFIRGLSIAQGESELTEGAEVPAEGAEEMSTLGTSADSFASSAFDQVLARISFLTPQ